MDEPDRMNGALSDTARETADHPRIAVALSDIRVMDAHKTDPGRTTGLIALIGLTGLVIAFGIAAHSIDSFGVGN